MNIPTSGSMEADISSPKGSDYLLANAQRSTIQDGEQNGMRTKRKRGINLNDDGGSDSSDEEIYDPDQPLAERRKVQKGFRDLLRDLTENSEEYIQTGSHGLYNTIIKANELTKQVRQTTEATIDSRLLVSTTDLSYRKTLRLTQGSFSQGIEVDEFMSKCITFMRQERENVEEIDDSRMTETMHILENSNGADDSEDRNGDMMNWCQLGKLGCLPHIRRPAIPGFLLGPLSLERKMRRVTKRSAPFRPCSLAETRPEVLNVDDFTNKESDLTAICGKIFQQLQEIQLQTQQAVADIILDDMTDEEKKEVMHIHGLRSTGGIDLMKFVVNPKSFGQTVENIFYVSFLIRDGRIEVDYDESGLPALAPVTREEAENGNTRQGSAKHQAVLSIDMQAWKDIIQTLRIKEPMITNREEAPSTMPGARGWYS